MTDRGGHDRDHSDRDDPRPPDWEGNAGGDDDDSTLTEDLPSWVTNVTAGADEVEKAEFSDEPDGEDDVAAALDALESLEGEVAAPARGEEEGSQDTLFAAESPGVETSPDSGDEYGVASRVAFAALGEPDDEEGMEEWGRFAGEPDPAGEPEPVGPSEEPGESPREEDAGRRAWWPLRRRRGEVPESQEAKEAEPEPADNEGDEGDLVWSVVGRPLVEEEPSSEDAASSLSEQEDEEPPEPDEEEWVLGAIHRGGPFPQDEAVAPPTEPEEELEEFIGEVRTGSGTAEHRGLAEEIFRASEEETAWQGVSAAMPGIDTGVVGFEDVADLESGEEYYEPAPSDLAVRVFTGLVLVGFLLGSLWVGGQAIAVFVGLVVLVGLGEYYTTLRRHGVRPLALFGYLAGLGILVAAWFHGPVVVPVALVLTAALTFFLYAFPTQRRDALTDGGLTVLGVAWIPGAAAFAFPLFAAPDFRGLVLGVVAVTVAMDVGSFAAGSMWGSRALAPILSPNKSVEGLAGGVIAAIAAAVAVGAFVEPFDLRSGAALGLVVAVMAPLGDLAESMVKRSLGVKDMGSILPGHGGILDRIDGFLFVVPAAWVLFAFLGLLA